MTKNILGSEGQVMHELAEAYSALRAQYNERYHGHLPCEVAEATAADSEVAHVYTEINREVVAHAKGLWCKPRALQRTVLDWHRRLRLSRQSSSARASGGAGAVVGAFYGTDDLSLRVWLEGVFLFYRRQLRRHLPEEASLLSAGPDSETSVSFETMTADEPQLARVVAGAVRRARQMGWASLGQLEKVLHILLYLMYSFDAMHQMVCIFTESTTSGTSSSSSRSGRHGNRSSMSSSSTAQTSICHRVLSAQLNRPGDFGLLLTLFTSCIFAFQSLLENQIEDYVGRMDSKATTTTTTSTTTTVTRSRTSDSMPAASDEPHAIDEAVGRQEGTCRTSRTVKEAKRMEMLSQSLRCLYRIMGICLSAYHTNATTILRLLLLRCTAATSQVVSLCASYYDHFHTESSTEGQSEPVEEARRQFVSLQDAQRSDLWPTVPLTEFAWRHAPHVRTVTTILPFYLHKMTDFLDCDYREGWNVQDVLRWPLYDTEGGSTSDQEENNDEGEARSETWQVRNAGLTSTQPPSWMEDEERKSSRAGNDYMEERNISTRRSPFVKKEAEGRGDPPCSTAEPHATQPTSPQRQVAAEHECRTATPQAAAVAVVPLPSTQRGRTQRHLSSSSSSSSSSLVYFGAKAKVDDAAAAAALAADQARVPSHRRLSALLYRLLRPIVAHILRLSLVADTNSNHTSHMHAINIESGGNTRRDSSHASAAGGVTMAGGGSALDGGMNAAQQIRELQDMIICVAHIEAYHRISVEPRVNWWPHLGLSPQKRNGSGERQWGIVGLGSSCFVEAMQLALGEAVEHTLTQLRASSLPAPSRRALLPSPATTTTTTAMTASHHTTTMNSNINEDGDRHTGDISNAGVARGSRAGSTIQDQGPGTTTTTTTTTVTGLTTSDAEHAGLTEASLLSLYRTLITAGPAFYGLATNARERCEEYGLRLRRAVICGDTARLVALPVMYYVDLLTNLSSEEFPDSRTATMVQQGVSLFTDVGYTLLHKVHPDDTSTALATLLVNSLHHYILTNTDTALARLTRSEPRGRPECNAASSMTTAESVVGNAATGTSATVPPRMAIVALRDDAELDAALRFIACLADRTQFYTLYMDLCRRRLLSPVGPSLTETIVVPCRVEWELRVHAALVKLYGTSVELQRLHDLLTNHRVHEVYDTAVGPQNSREALLHLYMALPPGKRQQECFIALKRLLNSGNYFGSDANDKRAMSLCVCVLNYRWWGFRQEAHMPASTFSAAHSLTCDTRQGETPRMLRSFATRWHITPSPPSSSSCVALSATVTQAEGHTGQSTADVIPASSLVSSDAVVSVPLTDPLPMPPDLQERLGEYVNLYAEQHIHTRLRWRQAAECYTSFTLSLRRRPRHISEKAHTETEGEVVQVTMHGTLLLQQLYMAIAQYGRRGVSYAALAARAGNRTSAAALAQLLRRHVEKYRLLVQLPPPTLEADTHPSPSHAHTTNTTSSSSDDVGAQRVALNVDYLLQLAEQQQQPDEEEGQGQSVAIRSNSSNGGVAVREFTHLPPRVLCLPLITPGQREERDKLRQRRVQIALVQLLKKARKMRADALYDATCAQLADRALSRVTFKRGVEMLIDSGLVERVDLDEVITTYRYVA